MSLTPYAEGFYAGVSHQREQILEFVEIHREQNVEITVDDILHEINHAIKKDMEAQVNAMIGGNLDKLINELDQLAYTISEVEKQVNELVTELGDKK
jgi:hypothetical protein